MKRKGNIYPKIYDKENSDLQKKINDKTISTNDYISSSMIAMFDGIRILITPGMVELGKDEKEYNYKFGTYAADCCDYILLVGKKHTEPIMQGALSKGFSKEKCLAYDKLEDAISYAYAIKGQGHKYILLENDLPDNY